MAVLYIAYVMVPALRCRLGCDDGAQDIFSDSRCCRERRRDEMNVLLFRICGLSFLLAGLSSAQAQQSIGTVGVQDATVAGALEVSNGRAILVGNATVTAKDRMAEIALNRGGSVRVCATSGLHVTSGKGVEGAGQLPLLLALDRGAIEVKMAATTRDVVMTPDLRFTMRGDGPLDLQLRVTRNGDTCVENRGAQAPVLNVADQFGEGTYELRAGQHVLFEHGSLKEVVDHESSACGCPPEPTMSVADALLHPGTPGSGGTGEKPAAEQHPFPAAVSAGLAPESAVPQASPGTVHTQVSAALSSSEGGDSSGGEKTGAGSSGSGAVGSGAVAAPASSGAAVAPPAAAAAPTAAAPAAAAGSAPEAQAKQKHDLVHVVGRFFKHIFGGG